MECPKGVEVLTGRLVKQLVAGGERTQVEAKEMLFPVSQAVSKKEMVESKKEFARDCASFSNTAGGYLFVGFQDEKKGGATVGCPHKEAVIEAFLQAAHDICKPPVDIDYKTVRVDNKRIAAFYIHKNEEQLVEVDGYVYYRTGKGKRRASAQKIYSLELRRRAREIKRVKSAEEGLSGDFALLSPTEISAEIGKRVIDALQENGFSEITPVEGLPGCKLKATKKVQGKEKTFFFYYTTESVNRPYAAGMFTALGHAINKLLVEPRLPAGKLKNNQVSKKRERLLEIIGNRAIPVIITSGNATATLKDYGRVPVRLKIAEGYYLGIGKSARKVYEPDMNHSFIIDKCTSGAEIDKRIALFSESVDRIIKAAEQ